jgi:FtsP/CotA-like multicopper oxidase with cupredoxin domain
MPSSSRSPLALLALAIAVSVLLATPPLSAEADRPALKPVAGAPLAAGPSVKLPEGFPGYSGVEKSGGFPDPFFLIKKTLVMSHIALELPVPAYEFVDVIGTFKNASNSIACGGTVSEGAAQDADSCRLQAQMQFQNGYMKTNGTVITPNATAYNGVPAGVVIEGHVGDIVQLTVRNEQPEAVNGEAIATGFYAPADNRQIVHWHGMELDNESDGTPVTEFGIETGEQRLYQYRLYRPGNYWFHPHVLPLQTEHRGMVGRLIIRSYEEDLLTLLGVLPLQKHLVQLHDSIVANEINRHQFRAGNPFNIYTNEEVDNHLMPDISPDTNGDGECDRADLTGDCITREGELIFVNGKVPTSDENIETIFVPQGRGVRVAFVDSSNERFWRFRLLLEGEEPPKGPAQQVNNNPAAAANIGQCYAPGSSVKFSGADPLSCDQGIPMLRIGGQNGLLDHARYEGQPEIPPANPFVRRNFDTVIRRGEDFIGVAERTEFVIVPKDREGNYLDPGESMYIWSIDYPHGAFAPFFDNNIGNGDIANRDINARKLVRIKIVPDLLGLPNYNLAEGAPLMAHPSINRPSENLRNATVVPFSAVPPGLDPFLGTPFAGRDADQSVVLSNRLEDNRRFPSINAVQGFYEGDTESGDEIPTQGATRYAKIGDVVEFVVANNTGAAHHPFHAHGFSFQPIALYRFNNVNVVGGAVVDGATLIEPPVYTYDYNEMLDVEGIQPALALKYRVKITDRFKIPDNTQYTWLQLLLKFPYDYQGTFGGAGDMPQLTTAEMGGGLGRWLLHCHILHHAGLGMMTDFCIAPEGATDASACKIDVDENIYKPIP